MNKFYVIEISEGADAIKGAAVYTKEDKDQAIALFHQKLATAMNSELFTSELVSVMDENGYMIRSEKYVKPVVEEA